MLNRTNLALILNQLIAPRISNTLNSTVPSLARVPKTIGAGKNLAWKAKLARGSSAGSFASGATIAGDDDRVKRPAILEWKLNKAEFSVALDAIAMHASEGATGMANAFMEEIMDAQEDLAVELGRQFWADGTGNGGLDLDGMLAIAANTGSYAGLSRATYSSWQAQVLGNSGTARALTEALMAQLETLLFTAKGRKPTRIVTTPAIYKKYEALFTATTRLQTMGNDPTYNLGAKELTYKGIPIERDHMCPAEHMFMEIEGALEFVQLKPVDMLEGFKFSQMDTLKTADGAVGLQVAIDILDRKGDSIDGYVKVYGNLKCTDPARIGVITDIDES